jgi:copper chaperone CopZ
LSLDRYSPYAESLWRVKGTDAPWHFASAFTAAFAVAEAFTSFTIDYSPFVINKGGHLVEEFSLELPAMYADHHVTEVRSLLLEIPGVDDVYASSGFQLVEVRYDDTVVQPDDISNKLEEAGYLGRLPMPLETDKPIDQSNGDRPFFRHSVTYQQTGRSLGFAQEITSSGRPLWPCPGMGPVWQRQQPAKTVDESAADE